MQKRSPTNPVDDELDKIIQAIRNFEARDEGAELYMSPVEAKQALIAWHSQGVGEAIRNNDGEPLEIAVDVVGGINKFTVQVVNPKNVADYYKAMEAVKELFNRE